MNIRPSAAIRQNYNEIAEMCRKTAYPFHGTGQQGHSGSEKERNYDCRKDYGWLIK